MGRAPSWLALALAASSACNAGRPLRPLSKGEVAAEVSVPGLWFRTGSATFPAAIPVIGARVGMPQNFEGTLRWDPAAAAFGIIGIEAGAVWHAFPANGAVPALHLSGEISTLSAPGHLGDGFAQAIRGAAAVDGIVHWEPTSSLWPYLVMQNAAVFANGTWAISNYAGLQYRISERWDISGEFGIEGWNLLTRNYSGQYLGVGGRGAIWMSWAVSYRFPAWSGK